MAPTVKALDLSNTSKLYYAPATVTTGCKVVHVAGQPGSTTDGKVPNDYESQIHLALLNLRKIIRTAGASIKDIAKLTLFIVDYDAANRKHTRHVERFLGGHRPAITLIPVPKLAVPSWLFEVDAVIVIPDAQPNTALSAPSISSSRSTQAVDVVIIGAGLAGLAAARDVMRGGLSCVVLEARDRVGGKTWSKALEEGKAGHVDLGAGWLNDTNQSRAYALAKEVGAELIEQNTTGNASFQGFDGKCSPFAYGDLPGFDATTRHNVARIRDMVEADCQAVDAWNPKDSTLDGLTFEAYLRQRGADDTAIATATVWTRAMLGQEPRDISALYFLNYCVSGGGLLQMRSDRKGGGQYLRVRQGTQVLSKGLAASLPEGTVRLQQAVRAISMDGHDAVKVQTSHIDTVAETTITAKKVITTVPGPALKAITFSPPLPPVKQMWVDSLTYGYYTKAMMEFTSPFWVSRGFCGLAQSFTGPAAVIRDSCVHADSRYVLTCFMAGDPGREWAKLSTSDREQALCKQIGELYGMQKGEAEKMFVRMSTYEWTKDEYAGWGCPCAATTPGVLDALGADGLRRPCGNLHFAGTETAGEWKGYMEGALRSGERAAKEVLDALVVGAKL